MDRVPEQKKKRKLFRFSLRSLLVLVTFVCIPAHDIESQGFPAGTPAH